MMISLIRRRWFKQEAVPLGHEQTDAASQGAAQRRVLPVHPLLFGAFPLLALYANNAGEIPIWQVYRPLGMAMIGTLAVWAVFVCITRHARKAALAASLTVLVFFSYGHIVNLLPPIAKGLVAPASAAGLALLLIAALRTHQPLRDATVILNLASAVLVAPSCCTIFTILRRVPPPLSHPTVQIAMELQTAGNHLSKSVRRTLQPSHSAKKQPDVYYIILDAYGRADSLKMFYGYDNKPFIRELEKRGFYIPSHSPANYNHTPLCLASALNMSYLDDMARRVGEGQGSLDAARQMLDDNSVADYLAKFGYHYVYVWTGAGQTRVDTADLVLDNQSNLSTFEGQALGLTALNAAPQTSNSLYERHRGYLLSAFRHLDSAARLPYSKFVFAHILAPHPPFVFGANGEPINENGSITGEDGSWLLQRITRQQYRSGYIAQLRYINRRVLEAVDAILKQSRNRPVIVVQGDHGSRMNLDWESQARTDLREPFSILNAYYVPDRVRKDLYDTISPVNSFRVILTKLFGANYPSLPDRSYYSTATLPGSFADVTHLISLKPPQTSAGRAVPTPLRVVNN